jgi:methionyl-tRNA formyltransferase
MKIAFCTCVQIGLSCIEAIHSIGGQFDLFITLKDEKAKSKSGRIYLDATASESNTPLIKINHINDEEALDALKLYGIDWLFIIGWSQIASPEVIKTPHLGAIGAHPSLLPVGRGRAAIPWAIIKGLDKTGVSFFKMDEGVDTGKVLGQFEIGLNNEVNATILYNEVNEAHVKLIKSIWPKIQNETLKGYVQDESNATYWEGRKPEDGLIRSSMTLDQVDKLVRATTKPYPGAFFINEKGEKVIVWKGSLRLNSSAHKINVSDGIYYAIDTELVKM